MHDSESQTVPAAPEIFLSDGLRFQFEITWDSVTGLLKPTPAVTSPGPIEITPRGAKQKREIARHEPPAPKIKKVAAIPAPPPPSEVQASTPPPPAPEFTPETQAPPLGFGGPSFAEPTESEFARRFTKLVVSGVLVAIGAIGYLWLGHGSDSGSADFSGTERGGAGWVTEWASDAAGSARGRQLSLYRPSLSMSNYDLEFLGRIERRSIGWVFRAADSSNYYAAKLEAFEPGKSAVAITHFAVIHGVEGPHTQRPLAWAPGPAEMIRIKLEARGPRFTISVQNQVVEDWEDDQLKTGGLGFLNERQEIGEIGSLKISFPRGGAH